MVFLGACNDVCGICFVRLTWRIALWTFGILDTYYSYEGEYLDSYYLGEPMILGEDVEISNTDIGEGKARVTYKFTDLYQNEYWTSVLLND